MLMVVMMVMMMMMPAHLSQPGHVMFFSRSQWKHLKPEVEDKQKTSRRSRMEDMALGLFTSSDNQQQPANYTSENSTGHPTPYFTYPLLLN